MFDRWTYLNPLHYFWAMQVRIRKPGHWERTTWVPVGHLGGMRPHICVTCIDFTTKNTKTPRKTE